MSRRVVITGAGCVSPLGTDLAQFWDHLAAGISGVGTICQFDASRFPVQIAAEVRGWNDSALRQSILHWNALPPQTRFAIGAAVQAGQEAGLESLNLDPTRVGVFLGCGELFPNFQKVAASIRRASRKRAFFPEEFSRAYLQYASRFEEALCDPATAVEHIAEHFQVQGPTANYTSACASSSIAVGSATEAIRRGDVDVMLAGGAHSMVNPFGLTGLCRMSVLSDRNAEPERASRPFDADRNGFVVGEGAAIVVLEDLQHALQRGAQIWGEVRGYASTHDAYRVTDPQPDGKAAARCLRLALEDARLNPEDIGYINAHGSSTVLNDAAETVAIKLALGPHAFRVPVSSTKSMTGHLTTACGAVEVLACLMAVHQGVLPPTINYETPDPRCDLDYVPNTAREVRCQHALNNNSGFGGQNASLIISRFDG
jgi:3-oxoacyl-[acyl-carrier-protein] synthase II